MKTLTEKYRPTSWREVIGHEKAIGVIERLKTRSIAGRSFWISGASGTGKTIIARLIAAEVADPFWIEEVDSADLTPARLREIEYAMAQYALGAKSGKAYIVNEAHGLRKDAIRQLLVLLERLPSHCVIIFTTTREGQESLFEEHEDSYPLLSRCIQLSLSSQGLCRKFAERALEIARGEGLDGRPLKAYENLMKTHRNNFRAALQEIEAGAMVETTRKD